MVKNLLALDLGRGSCGLALSRSGEFVTPLPEIRFGRDQFDKIFPVLDELLVTEKVSLFVIGYPSYPSGDPCKMTPIVEAFIPLMNAHYPKIPVVKQDERNSTKEASEILHMNGRNAKKQKRNIDSAAATVILERYLQAIGQIQDF